MNYLAHSFLSNNQPGLIVGNFIADHIHGNHFENFPPEIIEGVKLHRRIDTFTDSHLKFQESKRLFYNGFEKYSGILIDIYFDHLLAANFHNYSQLNLEDYCKSTYDVYNKHTEFLPQSSAGFLEYVLKNNVYFAYSSIDGIERVLYHLSQRINHGVWLNESVDIFKKNEERLKENFDLFFKDAIKMFL
ncbi:MAG: phosphodiesterase [Bacteroidetes bacterium]|jgi:acyl carrier protein phosphodiesterase|nr:phosphodiesterase [Bacteroidota bacterium]